MEDREIINSWISYNKKLEESLQLNRKNAEDITKIKIGSLLGSMKPIKVFTILTGIIWVCFVDLLIVNLFAVASPFFLDFSDNSGRVNKISDRDLSLSVSFNSSD